MIVLSRDKEVLNLGKDIIKRVLFFIYSRLYLSEDKDFRWIHKHKFKNTYTIGVVLGYGWGCVDALIPVMIYLKANYNVRIITLITCQNAGERRRVDATRWKLINDYSDDILINDSIELRPFRGIKKQVKKTIKAEIYFKSLKKELDGLDFDAFLVCDEYEEKSCAYWLRQNYSGVRSCGIHLNTYIDIPEDFSVTFSSKNIEYDYFCLPNAQDIKTIPWDFRHRFVVTGNPRADSWYINYIRDTMLKKKWRMKGDYRLVLGIVFPNLFYPERFDVNLRQELFKALRDLRHKGVLLLLKFHPRNDEGTIKSFIKNYIPKEINYEIVTCENTELAFESDKVIIVGMTDSRADIAVARKVFIEFYTKSLEKAFYKIYPVPGMDEEIRDFWTNHKMSIFTDSAEKLVKAIEEDDISTDGVNYETVFPVDRNASKYIADYLITGVWDDDVIRYCD